MNTSQIPPGGWAWYEPSTGWWAPHPIGHTFDQQVKNIIRHRLANAALTAKHNLSTDPAVVGQQLYQYQQKRGAISGDPLPKLTPPASSPHLSGAVKEAVAAVRKMASGSAALLEWEELGLPHVTQEVAEARAMVCVACPKNEKGKSLTEIFTAPVAEMIRKKIERKESINLRTSKDAQLETCQACLCPMKTKVWYPSELVLKRLKPDQKADLHESCWIRKLSSPTPSFPKDQSLTNTAPVSSEAG
jgi:hypothetical protein